MKKAPLLPVECIFGFKFFQDSYAHITDFVSWQIQMGPSAVAWWSLEVLTYPRWSLKQ